MKFKNIVLYFKRKLDINKIDSMYYKELWNITPEENTLPSKLDINCFGGWQPKMDRINITQLYFFREYHNELRWTCKSIRIIKMVGQTFKLTLDSHSHIYKVEMFNKTTGWVKIFTENDFPEDVDIEPDPTRYDSDSIRSKLATIFDDIEKMLIKMIVNLYN